MKNSAVILLVLLICSCSSPASESSSILSAEKFQEELMSDPEIILLDIRTPQEVSEGSIKGSVNIDYSSGRFDKILDSLDHSKTYFVYCAGGKRSGAAVDLMKEKGFRHVSGLEGGLNAWKAKEFPVQQP
ncbi:MAG: rhodanese-like domain-containing protein [Cyclobacteriaceae bacterium]|nr:rhodanese-like domain-containing protein [Cyclobacteriaceae bacterium]